jgi:hypothetical protein
MQCFASALVSVRIRIHSFLLNAGPDRGPGSQTNVDPDPDPAQILKSQKVGFWHEKIFYVDNTVGTVPYVIKHSYVGINAILKD